MDRRIAKTRRAIFAAFDALIVKTDYAKISVQNIIDEADIGRSTFYEHFETKDELLRAKCKELFEHIFVPSGTEATHALSRNSTFKEKIMHILYHLLDDKKVIKGILASEGRQIFLQYFRSYLAVAVEREKILLPDVPDEFLKNHITGSFIEMVSWWADRDFKESPEDMTCWFFSVMPPLGMNAFCSQH